MKTFGLRHIAINVKDPQASKAFYTRALKMQVEWEPDADNVYLTSGGLDNLAIHKSSEEIKSAQRLDHMGFFVPEPNDVDEWYTHIKTSGGKIEREIKTHRDGARSFYFSDPDGIITQVLYHEPISKKALSSQPAQEDL